MIPNNCIGRKLKVPFISNRKFKKKQVCVKDAATGKIVNIHYGDKRYQDFTQHHDMQRRKSFRKRHKCDPASKLDILTPRRWACQDLW